MSFSRNFQIFIFTIKFLSITKFFPPPLTAKIVIKKDCFWYVWTDKPQNFSYFPFFIIFLLITKFFPPPLMEKIVNKRNCLWFVRTDKPQNFSLRTSFRQCNANWLPYKVLSPGVVQ